MADAASQTLSGLHASVRGRLRAAGLESPDEDARILVLVTFGATMTDLVAGRSCPVERIDAERLESRVLRRLTGEPVYRIVGSRPFYGIDLALSSDTLEPRPDTEILVDTLRPHVEKALARKGDCRILDLGTGTGAIALALLALYPAARALGVDMAAGALSTARRNADALGVSERFDTARGDWFVPVIGTFDIIASNPPYISASEWDSLSPEVKQFDPRLALYGGVDGLDCYRVLAAGGEAFMEDGAVFAVEIGHRQQNAVTRIFLEAGYVLNGCALDMAGRDRVLSFRRP